MRSLAFMIQVAFIMSCGGAATTGLAPAPEAPRPPPAEDREPLLPGARLVERLSAEPMVTLRVVFDAGSAEDPGGLEGLTRLTARWMAEGGTEALSYAELSRWLYPMAGAIEVQVGRDQTTFIGRVHRDHVEGFYALFRDVLVRPRLADDDFTRLAAQANVALTLDLRSNRDEDLGKEGLQALIYRGHPFAHPPLGTERGLSAAGPEDARRHRSRVFCGARALIGVSGDAPPDLGDRLRRALSNAPSEACVGRRRLPTPERAEGRRLWVVSKPDAEAVAVSMGMPIDVTRGHPDYPALLLAAAHLGQHRQFVGRLMQEIRTRRGLNYGDYAYAEHFTQEGWGRFPLPNDARRQQYFSIWLRPLRPEQAHFAIRLAVSELERLVSAGISEEDFARVRDFLLRYLPLYQQTGSRRLGFALDDVFYGAEAPWLAQVSAVLERSSAAEVNEAIARHIDPERLAIITVASDAERLLEALTTDAASPITYRAEVAPEVLEADEALVSLPLRLLPDESRIIPAESLFH